MALQIFVRRPQSIGGIMIRRHERFVLAIVLIATVALLGFGKATPALANDDIAPQSLIEEVEDTFKNFRSPSYNVTHYDSTTRKLVFRTSYRYDGAKQIDVRAGTYGRYSGTIYTFKQIYYTW